MTYGKASDIHEEHCEINGRPYGCYCDEDQGAGYTFHDEHGYCNVCENIVREMMK